MDQLVTKLKHDHKWRFNVAEKRMYTYEELVERRNIPQREDFVVKKFVPDKNAEKKRVEA